MTELELIFFAGVAVFFIYKLWSVLGKTNGQEQARAAETATAAEKQRMAASVQPKTLDLKPEKVEPQEIVPAGLESGVKKIKLADKSFTLTGFKKLAEEIFEQVIKTFSGKQITELKALLSTEVFGLFEEEIKNLEAAGNNRNTTLISMKVPEVLSVEFENNIAQILVRFSSEQVTLVKNKSGEIVEGAVNQSDHVTESWIFERDFSAKKSGWVVAGIDS